MLSDGDNRELIALFERFRDWEDVSQAFVKTANGIAQTSARREFEVTEKILLSPNVISQLNYP